MSVFRRRYITEPRYQIGFAVALLRGFAIAILGPACIFLTAFFAAAKGLPEGSWHTALAAMPMSLAWFLLIVAGCALVTFGLGVYISHKFVGPLKRVEAWSALRLLGQSADKPVLRPGDELGGIVAGLANLTATKKSL